MSREIKFQFIFKGQPFGAEIPYFNWVTKTYTLEQLIGRNLNQLCHEAYALELVAKRQYTGLRDANDVEIYEFDLVRWGENVETVRFDDGSFQTESSCIDSSMEVIGNIYTHSELLISKEG